jgi:acyl dehydratase
MATVTTIRGIEGLKKLVGVELPPSPWFAITQEQVDTFARTTRDEQWIHVDAARAAASPFRTTVAHGFFTLSLIPYFWHASAQVDGFAMAINYGLNSVRFPTPVPVPSRLRARFRVDEVVNTTNGAQALLNVRIEREGEAKPACVAEMVIRYLCQ